GDVGLGNVDNTSDATKNAASVTLTNKSIDASQLTGTISNSRLATSVPTSISNDTNVTGSISGNVLTLGWTSILAKARLLGTTVFTDQANSYTAGMKQSVQASATNAGFNFGGVSADPSSAGSGD